MPKGDSEKQAELRVVEEETHTEEVLRLGGDSAEEISRIEVSTPLEEPMRLPTEESDADRRTHEPDIDVIIEDAKESEDLEDGWQEGRQKGPAPYGWFVLIFVGLVLAMGWSLGWFSDEAPEISIDRVRQESVERLEEESFEVLEAMAQVERVELAVREYASAKTWQELLPLVRNRERVEPIMRDWYTRQPYAMNPFGRMTVFDGLDMGERNFFVAGYEFKGSAKSKTLLVEDLGDQGVLVDWETDVCYQPMPWDRFVEDRPAGVQRFRVWIEADRWGLYSHEFQDEDQWFGLQLTALGSDQFLIGYVPRGGELAERLRELIEDHGFKKVAVLLDLKVPKDVQSLRGVIIEDLVSERWLIE